jgi:hypothetical protein
MTVRYLLVAIDDAKPLGPQLAGARLWGISWKLLRQLAGGISTRHLQRLVEASHFCDRQAVEWRATLPPPSASPSPGEDDVNGRHLLRPPAAAGAAAADRAGGADAPKG